MEQIKKATTRSAKPVSEQSAVTSTAPAGAATLSGQARPTEQVWSKYIDSRMKQFGSR